MLASGKTLANNISELGFGSCKKEVNVLLTFQGSCKDLLNVCKYCATGGVLFIN